MSDLDAKCCRFAGLEPERWKHSDQCISNTWRGQLHDFPAECICTPDPIWPPVSTDWGAAGKLMDALKVNYLTSVDARSATIYTGFICIRANPLKQEARNACTGPTALALAVAALADAERPRSRKSSGTPAHG
jgi:hypothetical protein